MLDSSLNFNALRDRTLTLGNKSAAYAEFARKLTAVLVRSDVSLKTVNRAYEYAVESRKDAIFGAIPETTEELARRQKLFMALRFCKSWGVSITADLPNALIEVVDTADAFNVAHRLKVALDRYNIPIPNYRPILLRS